ncbi:GNAT family N-acetyltransferase [Ferruginibacter sp. SUN002]|uniref:GNAT family N-acetyltransferase n=1 Tax=Ferruginibacter sp. SUN002 TaxID=2937789 RepID=UPI003D3661DB
MNILFETPRLVFRQFTKTDAELLLDLNSSPEVVKYVHEPVLQTIEQAENILVNIILPQYENNLGRWAMYLKSNNEFIGWCGLKYIKEDDEIDLGYRIFEKYWGNGYASEAAAATIEYGLKKLNLSTIIAKAHIDNIASWKILEKIGMQYLKETNDCDGRTKVYIITK